MSKTWKWILGVALGLIVLSGLGFVAVSYFGYGHMAFLGRPMMDDYGFGNRGPMGGTQNFGHPMMGRRGFGGFGLPFLFFGGLLRLFLPLVVLGLVAFFSYQAGKRAGWNEARVVPAPAPQPEVKEDAKE